MIKSEKAIQFVMSQLYANGLTLSEAQTQDLLLSLTKVAQSEVLMRFTENFQSLNEASLEVMH